MTRPTPHDANGSPVAPAVLFLDFDGVLNTDAWRRTATRRFSLVAAWSPEVGAALLSPEHCASVQRICDATGAVIVLVTGWRRWMPGRAVGTLAPLLRDKGITAPVIGEVGQHFSGDSRGRFIADWLDESSAVTAWCVLDDDTSYYGEESVDGSRVRYHDPRFVGRCVHPRDGVTDEDAARCIAILHGEVAE